MALFNGIAWSKQRNTGKAKSRVRAGTVNVQIAGIPNGPLASAMAQLAKQMDLGAKGVKTVKMGNILAPNGAIVPVSDTLNNDELHDLVFDALTCQNGTPARPKTFLLGQEEPEALPEALPAPVPAKKKGGKRNRKPKSAAASTTENRMEGTIPEGTEIAPSPEANGAQV